MKTEGAQPPDWQRIDTALFDLDGTLLDLCFDNHLWREIVPQAYAASRAMSLAEARAALQTRLRACAGTLDWYCMEYWTRELELDVTALHRTHARRIDWLPGAREALAALKARGGAVRPRAHAVRRRQRARAAGGPQGGHPLHLRHVPTGQLAPAARASRVSRRALGRRAALMRSRARAAAGVPGSRAAATRAASVTPRPARPPVPRGLGARSRQ